MRHAKSRHPILEADILLVFDDACLGKLASIAKLPADADAKCFREGVREAARIYARDACVATDNELHAEVCILYRAAERKRYEDVAVALKKLSPRARKLLKERTVQLPAAEHLRSPTLQQKACEAVLRCSHYGGRYVEGRRRSYGKRSRTWRPLLRAPKHRRNFARRDVERDFVVCLQLAWLEATGKKPSLTANAERPGPFVKMTKECLGLVGAGHADVIGLFNELNRRRKIMTRRVTHQL